ncbi:hypothetical protein L596_018975 [Steinernema carpocapsae]|uniref:Uncharacterized protein n=1 Tax=Steinernema carpocapsae TaxID=34508 RepID=A0A4V6A268_STECR|nr:hypothetical protein L596_018975 [Steinernema carpocapsae]
MKKQISKSAGLPWLISWMPAATSPTIFRSLEGPPWTKALARPPQRPRTRRSSLSRDNTRNLPRLLLQPRTTITPGELETGLSSPAPGTSIIEPRKYQKTKVDMADDGAQKGAKAVRTRFITHAFPIMLCAEGIGAGEGTPEAKQRTRVSKTESAEDVQSGSEIEEDHPASEGSATADGKRGKKIDKSEDGGSGGSSEDPGRFSWADGECRALQTRPSDVFSCQLTETATNRMECRPEGKEDEGRTKEGSGYLKAEKATREKVSRLTPRESRRKDDRDRRMARPWFGVDFER